MVDKTAVFLDGGYLDFLSKNTFKNKDGSPKKVDLGLFAENLSKQRGCNLLRTYYYCCPPYQKPYYPTDEEKRRVTNYAKFVFSIRKLKQFKVREGRLQKVFDEKGEPDFIQKGVDVKLAIDMLKLALNGAIQTAILVACDSDFVPVVRALQEEGVVVHLYYFPSKERDFSQQLVDECDDRHALTKGHFNISRD